MNTRVLFSTAALLCATQMGFAQDGETGLIVNKPGAFEGYTIFSPLDTAMTYLIDNDGHVVHTWESEYRSGAPYLLDDGNLLRTASLGNEGNGHFHGGGAGYGVQLVSWEGDVLWEFIYASEDYLMHHDIAPMPNGNVLILAWEGKTVEEAVAAGRDPELLDEEGLWPEHIIEVEPQLPGGGKIVWEWHLWDHVIQDYDETKANFGDVAAHPELVDINPPGLWLERISDEERERLEALGYLGDDSPDDGNNRRRGRGADWQHVNAINYNAELDQIALSALGNNEIWIIDHSTTTEEAAGHTGGRYGKGGDLLYRWGNPLAYRLGAEADQKLFAQHDVHWIPEEAPGAGNLLVFNNGRGRPEGNYSSVIELVPPQSAPGVYTREPGNPFGPEAPAWEYTAPEREDFYSSYISGAQRLPNGNTLVCEGATGTFFEVTPEKDLVWKFVNPVIGPKGASHRDPDDEPNNNVFRAYRLAPDYPGLKGKDLTPGPPLSDYIQTHPPKAPSKNKNLDQDP